jgi:hypothetical protein
MKNRTQSSGQNSQVVRWWVLVHCGRILLLVRPGKSLEKRPNPNLVHKSDYYESYLTNMVVDKN